MDVAVEDEAAGRFAEGLYRGIGAGESLANSFAAALFEDDADLPGLVGGRQDVTGAVRECRTASRQLLARSSTASSLVR